jgi:hypothetical protein
MQFNDDDRDSSWLTYHDVDDPLLATCILWSDGTADVWAPEGEHAVALCEVARALKRRHGEQ